MLTRINKVNNSQTKYHKYPIYWKAALWNWDRLGSVVSFTFFQSFSSPVPCTVFYRWFANWVIDRHLWCILHVKSARESHAVRTRVHSFHVYKIHQRWRSMTRIATHVWSPVVFPHTDPWIRFSFPTTRPLHGFSLGSIPL